MRASFPSSVFTLFIGLALSLQALQAQTPSPTPTDDAVTEKEKLELRVFTQDLLAKLKKTRDVRPLRTRYFADDFESFSYLFMSDDEPKLKALKLSRSGRQRLVVASLNFMYVMAPYTLPLDNFEKRLSAPLRRRYRMIEKSTDDENFKTRRSFLRYIRDIYVRLRALRTISADTQPGKG